MFHQSKKLSGESKESLQEPLLLDDLKSEDNPQSAKQKSIAPEQQIKLLTSKAKSLNDEVKRICSLVKELQYLHKVDDLDQLSTPKDRIKNIYKELLKAHPQEKKLLTELHVMMAGLYEKRIAKVILSIGLKKEVVKDGIRDEVWETKWIDQNEMLKDNYKKALVLTINEFQIQNVQRMAILYDIQQRISQAQTQLEGLKLDENRPRITR